MVLMPLLKSIQDIDWEYLLNRSFTASPQTWSDQVMYFLLVDRFSDGSERIESLYTPNDANSVIQTEDEAEKWRSAGYTFCGGTLKGVQSKLGYLKRLGVTTIWLSPVLQQAQYDSTSYHGYGAQNFLEIDAHFGSREDLKSFVDEAHQLGMYVVLDIVVNHAGFVFEYDVPINSETEPNFKADGQHPVKHFHDQHGRSTLPFGPIDQAQYPEAWPHGAIWPSELQHSAAFNCRGCIGDWENPDEYLHGDFKLLKDFNLGTEENNNFQPSAALQALTQIYQYWLAYADLDGFRLDAVKHMGKSAVSYFTQEIQLLARKIGKQNFAIFGEIPGGERQARDTMDQTGVSATLALLDVPDHLEKMIKGKIGAWEYFKHFDRKPNVEPMDKEEITWKKDEIVLFLDDHDQIRKNFDKARFTSGSVEWQKLAFPALATLVCSAGIPCIYYGSEQGFDGQGRHDRYIRETMFASGFGAFRARDCHFFDEHHEIYQQLQQLLAIRQQTAALCQGTQQLLQISGDGEHFGYPDRFGDRMLTIIPWLRQTPEQTILCAVSTDPNHSQSVWVNWPTNSSSRHQSLRCIFSKNGVQTGRKYPIEIHDNLQRVKIDLPAASFALFQCLD